MSDDLLLVARVRLDAERYESHNASNYF